jgi:hypothetical protein
MDQSLFGPSYYNFRLRGDLCHPTLSLRFLKRKPESLPVELRAWEVRSTCTVRETILHGLLPWHPTRIGSILFRKKMAWKKQNKNKLQKKL